MDKALFEVWRDCRRILETMAKSIPPLYLHVPHEFRRCMLDALPITRKLVHRHGFAQTYARLRKFITQVFLYRNSN